MNFAKPIRLLIAVCCAVLLVLLAVSYFKRGESTAPPPQSTQPAKPAQQEPPAQSQPTQVPVPTETRQTPTPDTLPPQSAPSADEPRGSSAITAFREWAETLKAVGQDNADQTRGMELARARASEMKELIKKDPAMALREALPANLRAELPQNIAAAIEQPVKPTGTVSMRMMCKHSPDTPHGNCESAPVLVEDVISWNAYYDEQKWSARLGERVQLNGIAVDEELAVESVTPDPPP